MGSRGRREDEEPERRIFISGFEMARAPITNREYGIFLEASKTDPPPWWHDPQFSRPQQPVVGVNWFEAQAYCHWLSEETGLPVRLPTEAEREKALGIVRSDGGIESAITTAGDYVTAAVEACDLLVDGPAADALRQAPGALLATVMSASSG